LPTNRVCDKAIQHLANEAMLAGELFNIDIVMLILDTSDSKNFALNKFTIDHLGLPMTIQVIHLSRSQQREYIKGWINEIQPPVTYESNVSMIKQLLPDGVSYGAAMNRAFLFSNHLGCDTIHRRDSDSDYQYVKGKWIYPIIHELRFLGSNNEAVNKLKSKVPLGSYRDIHLVGGSYVGAWSMDVEGLYDKNRQAFYNSVGLCMPDQLSDHDKHTLVDELFVNRDVDVFQYDEIELGYANTAPIDMCNVSFWRIHQQLPVPNALDTIGTDYFLIAILQALEVPTVHHNRHIKNYHTARRKTESGFIDYQCRIVKFYLYMSYLYAICAEINGSNKNYVDDRITITAGVLSRIIKSIVTPQKLIDNKQKLQKIIDAYDAAGGSYQVLSKQLVREQDNLVQEAQNDMQLFAEWLDLWDVLIHVSARQQCKGLGS